MRPRPRRTAHHIGAADPEGIWLHAVQMLLNECYVYDLHGDTASAVAALGLTTLSAAQVSPERLNWLGDLDRGRVPLPTPPC
jgi:hypothetical protein